MKRTISLLLSFIIVFAMAVPCFAEDINEPEFVETVQEFIETEVTEAPEETEDIEMIVMPPVYPDAEIPVMNAVTAEDDVKEWGDEPVVKVYLCATISSLTGHIWLYFVNLTPYELPLGYVTLKPYEEMSVGSLRNTRTDGGGTYYNGEAYMADSLVGVRQNTVSTSMDLTYSQLLTIGSKIKSKNSYIILGNNCGDFACACWNSVAPVGKKVVNILVPIFTIIGVFMAGGVKGQVEMKRPDISRVFKQTNNGVKQATASSFNASCVNW